MIGRISWFAYVRHSDRAAFEALGWVHSADLRSHHSAYSSLYEWRGEGEPVMPRDVAKTNDQKDVAA